MQKHLIFLTISLNHQNISISTFYLIVFPTRVIFMNQSSPPLKKNKPFSQSLKKMMGMTNPISPECTRYLQRTHSQHMKKSFNLPTLLTNSFKCSSNKNRSTQILRRELSEQSREEKPQNLRETNETNTSKEKRQRRLLLLQGRRTNMQKQVDEIMNEVIVTLSPRLCNNPSIKHSISTKKFKNVRIMTDPDDSSPNINPKTSLLIKEILAFMMKHSNSNKRHKETMTKQDPEIYNEDLSRYNPIKLIKKSQEILGLYPVHQFKRDKNQSNSKALNSQAYIKQLRTGKLYVKELHLKRH